MTNFTEKMLADIDRPVLPIEAGADELIAVRHFETMTRLIPGARALRLPTMTRRPSPFAAEIAAAARGLAVDTDSARS